MPNGKTQNYQLSQWEKTDQVRMEDFNADNLNIENALTGLETSKADVSAVEELKTEVAQKAEQTALTALESQVNGLSAGKADAAKLTALESQVNGLSAGKADAAKLTALESQVNGLSAGKADAAKLTALESQVNGLSTGKADASALTAEVNARTTADQSLTAALEKKADASALSALQTVVNGKGNCLIEFGRYVGDGTGRTITVTGTFKPKLIIVIGIRPVFMFQGSQYTYDYESNSKSYRFVLTWSGNSVSWVANSSSSAVTLNALSTTYNYMIFG